MEAGQRLDTIEVMATTLYVSTPWKVFTAALALRLFVIVFGEIYDGHFAVKYTDVDYKVFTDAARLLAEGRSPYLRPTYRYTPLLACLMVPNVTLHPACGKLLFVLADLLVGVLLFRVLRERDGATVARATSLAAVWLFNPLSINMSTRGSADSLVGAMLLAMVYALLRRRDVAAGAIFGLAVHFRLYPAVYTPVLGLHLLCDGVPLRRIRTGGSGSGGGGGGGGGGGVAGLLRRRLASLASWAGLGRAVRFGIACAAAFVSVTAACAVAFGPDFLEQTYFYHGHRVDTRHNFSPYFLGLYLCDGAGHAAAAAGVSGGAGATLGAAACVLRGRAASLAPFAPQLFALLALSFALRRELPAAMYLTTLTFVAFNKVCTAQYYLWYAFFLPLVLTRVVRWRAWSARRGALALAAWCAAHLHWLYWANRLENNGDGVFPQIWLASALYFAVNVAVVAAVLLAYRREARVYI